MNRQTLWLAGLMAGVAIVHANMSDPQAVLWKIKSTNDMEIQMANTAKAKSSSAEVKQYADTLIADHQASQQKVQEVATRMNYDLNQAPPTVDSKKVEKHDQEESKQMEKLNGLSGTEFDKAYIRMMADGHAKVAAKLKDAKKELPEGDVKNFVSDTIPTIEKHRTMAESIKKNLAKS